MKISTLKFTKSIKRQTVNEIAYDELKSAILLNKLDPDKLYSEEEFAKALGISRTPVREAIKSLIDDRLLQTGPRRGVKVREFTPEEITQIFMLRKAIEREVLLEFIKVVTTDHMETLQSIIDEQVRALEKKDNHWFMELDQDFHKSFIGFINYQLVEDVYMNLHNLTALIGHQAIRKEGRMHEVIKEHQSILDALVNKEDEIVIDEMLNHLDHTKESYNNVGS